MYFVPVATVAACTGNMTNADNVMTTRQMNKNRLLHRKANFVDNAELTFLLADFC